MRRITIRRLVLLLLLQLVGVSYGIAQKQTTLTCKVNGKANSGVYLYKVENGEAASLGFRWPAAVADTCIFSLPLSKEGIYFLRKAGNHASEFKHVIYLKPGDNKQVDLYLGALSGDYDSCKVWNVNKETVYLQAWLNRFNAVARQGSNRTKKQEFIAAYNQIVKDAPMLKSKAITNNAYFNRLFSARLDADIQYLKAASFFYFGERMNSELDTSEQRSFFYKSLAGQKFCDAGILGSENGLQLVKFSTAYNLYYKFGSQKQMLETSFTDKVNAVCNNNIRLALVQNRMPKVTNYATFKTDITPFKNLFVSEPAKKAYQKREDELTVYAKGAPAYDFSLNDTKGNHHSLSDFKGKVVVLDVWAMWCAPCLAEKPNFLKIEEEFSQRDDIIFIGVSTDGLPRKDIWKNFVDKKGWKNIELLSNHDESIMKYYKIEGIPRFMIFDKEGNIITVDAPRPSTPDFKKLIEETLKSSEHASHP